CPWPCSAAETTSPPSSAATPSGGPPMARTAAFCAAPSALLAWSWLRLGQPHASSSTALWLVALAVAPALLPRMRLRLLALVPAGWPATLLTGPDDLKHGVALLAVVLSFVAGLGERPQPRRLGLAAIVGGALVLAAFVASTSSAVAIGQVLHWQAWDFYTKPPKPVGVEYVWDSNYTGLHFPKKVTTILTIKAPSRPTYWRATTLDEFDGGGWFEDNVATVAQSRRAGLYVETRALAPPFGAPHRAALMADLFRNSYRAQQYDGFYQTAKRVVGETSNPYAAALELEGWFRSSAFHYDQTPPPIGNVPPLAAFVMQTRRGYCQHFAGAMALMLRYLGIPARVAAGFTSGEYDRKTHEWTVTDHDAHTWVEAWFPRYGWLPFDPTPGRGSLDGTYTTASPHFDLSDGLLAVASHLKRPGSFNLRRIKGGGQAHAGAAAGKGKAHAKATASGARIGALVRLLILV